MSPTGALWSREELAEELTARRSRGELRRVVLANGCFDVLHPGHVHHLRDARALGDALVVALNSDASVRGQKGPGRPLQTLADRAEVVGALRAVDYVTSFDEPTLHATLRALRPEVHAKGLDYAGGVPEAALDLELGIELALTGPPKERSSSELIARLGDPP